MKGRVLFIAFVLTLPQARSSAQRSPTLTGRVADALGQALPGVVVTAGPMGGGQVTQTHTRDDGTYQLTTGRSDVYQVDFDRVFAGLAEGGEVLMPLQTMRWSPRYGVVRDRFGIRWEINCDAEPAA